MSSYPFNFKCSYERFPKMQFMSTLHLGALFEFPFCHLISFHYSAVFIPCAGICGATTLVTSLRHFYCGLVLFTSPMSVLGF